MFDVWTKDFRNFFLVFLVLGLVNGLLGTLLVFAIFGVFLAVPSGFIPTVPGGLPSGNLVGLILFFILAAVGGVILNSIVTGGMVYYSVRRFRGETITLEAALRKGLEKFLSIFGANLLLSLLIFGVILVPLVLLLPLTFSGGTIDPTSAIATICGALALLVVGSVFVLYISVAMSLNAPAIMMENTNAVGGLRRSWRLTKGHWWSLFGAIVIAGILGGIITSAIAIPVSLIRSPIASLVASAVATGIVGAWSIIVSAVAYDLIVRQPTFAPPFAPPYYPGPTMAPPPTAPPAPSQRPPAPPRGP
jgi:membrane-anchored glycerophosphoryl diester phosphodiesterase (GDPDase)